MFVTALLQQLRTNQLTLGETASALAHSHTSPDAVTLQQRVLSPDDERSRCEPTVFLSGRAWATIESRTRPRAPGTLKR